ncbi:hypothetical protein [Streptomyces antibioticus]|uniref:hypothetical protein n=1 Tax=Streptomyces antibioticus TaxID=1890 RepID=UPI003D7650A9
MTPCRAAGHAARSTATGDEKGREDTGGRGRSGRPSGSKDTAAFTGVAPQEPQP